MPRGRKRRNVFIPMPWIPNSSSEDEHQEEVVPDFEPQAQVPRVQDRDVNEFVRGIF